MKRFIPCASALLCLCLSLFSVASGATTEFPNKPVRLIIPYPPGGGTDILARLVASKVSETMKWNIVTENRPGAGGSIGLEAAARSTPDGYTLCLAETSNLAINPALYPNLGYDPETDFSPIMFIGSLPLVLVVSADSHYHSVASLVADAKKNPLTMASSGNGTVGHLAGEMFKIQAGIPILHAPYATLPSALQVNVISIDNILRRHLNSVTRIDISYNYLRNSGVISLAYVFKSLGIQFVLTCILSCINVHTYACMRIPHVFMLFSVCSVSELRENRNQSFTR